LEAPVEMRKAVRYRLQLPVLFSWSDSEGKVKKSGGFTRDISTRGLYIVAETSPRAGAALECEVLLPISKNTRLGGVRLVAMGNVVRSGGGNEHHGFAVAGDLNTLRRINTESREYIAEQFEAGEG
jgi:hypothetical protein